MMEVSPTKTVAMDIRDAVAERYSAIGSKPAQEESISCGRDWALKLGYPLDLLDGLPETAVRAFTGIGKPVLLADLKPGETVVDVGCGGGLDSIVAARMVGAEGFVFGFDFAPGMISAARRAVAAAGLNNIQVKQAGAEDLPLGAQAADVVLVNGLFNLAPDKPAVAREVHRILRENGRLIGAEIVLTAGSPAVKLDLEDWFR